MRHGSFRTNHSAAIRLQWRFDTQTRSLAQVAQTGVSLLTHLLPRGPRYLLALRIFEPRCAKSSTGDSTDVLRLCVDMQQRTNERLS